MENFDVVVIGAGPGGYVAAIRSAQLGLKTTIIDKQWLGGVCLNVGCIPSKSLLKNAEIAHTLRERSKEFGFSFDNLKLDYSSAVKRSRQVSDRLVRGIGFLMKKNNINVIFGTATISSVNTVKVIDKNGTSQEISTKNIIIATGSHSSIIPGIEIDGHKVLTYREAILQERLPASAIIIGAGAIGLEFATIWNSYGSKVSIIEMLPSIAPLEDSEVSSELLKSFNSRGIEIHTDTRVKNIETTKTGVKVVVENKDTTLTLEAEQVLIATGFKPNTHDHGLEEIGVKLSEQKHVIVDGLMKTSVPGIWAIGDVTGKLLLAHVASKQGVICAEAIAGMQPLPINYLMVPRATYCHPQIASFGLTEKQAIDQGKTIKVGRFPFQANGKALGLGDSTGFAKIIVDEKYGEILGAHMIGPEVSELLPELTLAQQNELTIDEISNNIHAHPTLSEVMMEAAENASGSSVNI